MLSNRSGGIRDIKRSVVAHEVQAAAAVLPLVVPAPAPGADLVAWIERQREDVAERLAAAGGLLFRGFARLSADAFERFISVVSDRPLSYNERSSPRGHVAGNIYTSTEHPPSQSIFPHSENSYQRTWPLRIFFLCHVAPRDGGETPLVDNRRLRPRIPDGVWERFAEKGVLYVRNFDAQPGLGLPWQTVFQTDSRDAVEDYCRAHDLAFEWRSGDRLRTRAVRPAVMRHPVTGDLLWFNHAAFFHVSTLEPALRQALLASFREEDLPNNTYYGDGSPIEPDVLDLLRQAYAQETVSFPWREGDLLMLDNMVVSHGRRPYTGPRQILVGMSEPTTAPGTGSGPA